MSYGVGFGDKFESGGAKEHGAEWGEDLGSFGRDEHNLVFEKS